MAFYLLKKNNKVIDVLSDDSNIDVNKLLLDGKIDAIEKVANFEDVKSILLPDGVQNINDSQFDRLVRQLTKSAETFVDDLCNKINSVQGQSGKDIGTIAERAKSAGKNLLKEIREIHAKALEKANKKSKKE